MNLFMLVSRLLFLLILRSETGCLGFENQMFGIRSITKTNLQGLVLLFLVALGSIYMTFVALETRLTFVDFSG